MDDAPTPMDTGSPPLAPPGLTKRVETVPPRPRRPAPPAAPLLPDTPEFLARVEAAVVDYLSKRPARAEMMTKLGVHLRAQALAPQDGLKKFMLRRKDKFHYYDDDNNTNWVALVSRDREDSAGPSAAAPAPAPPAALPPAAAPSAGPAAAVPPGVDEKLLERQLVSYVLEKGTQDSPVNLPVLGEYCIKHLGFSMKGYLSRFLSRRLHLFRITDDGRQHVILQPGAAEAVGAVSPLPPLPDELPGGGARGRRGAPAPAAPQRPADYPMWDRLSQVIHDFLVSRGGAASFNEVDAHMAAHHAALIEEFGYPLSAWDTKKFTWKRRNIFRKDGPLVAVHRYAPATVTPAAAAEATAAAARALALLQPASRAASREEEAFPPLGAPAARGGRANGAAAPAAAAAAPAPSADAAAAARALAEERRALEALRDEVQGSLNALKALSELQKENAGLRAACLTLGREVLAIKEDVAALKAGLNSAPGGTTTPSSASAGTASDAAFLGAVGASPAGGPTAPTIALIGGHDSASWLDSVETFCPSTGAWGALPPQARSFAAAAAGPDGSLYVAGGGNGVEWYDSAAVLAPSAPAWRPLAPLRLARGSAAAGFAQGYFYVFGGGKPGEQYSAVEWYDPAADRWLAGPELGVRRFALAGAALDGALYAVGGYDGRLYLKTVERLDPREGRWAPVAPMAGQRGGTAVAAAGGTTLYALGGYSKAALQTCEVYDARADAWRAIAPLKDCRAYGAAAPGGGDGAADVFVLGGLRSDMTTHAPLMERYCPATDAWEDVELPAHVNPRRSFLAAATLLPAV